MKHALLVLAILPLACSNAAAAPAPTPVPPRSPPPAACRPTGAVVFAIDHRVDRGVEPAAKLPTSTAKVFANGAWTRDEADPEGKPLAPAAGCLAKPDLKQLEATLAGATWKVTKAQVHCMAVSATFTVYEVRGRPVFTQRLCSGEVLDDKSRGKLDAAVALVEGAAKPPK